LNTTKAQKITKRGTQMAHKAAVVFAFLASINIDAPFKMSTKISTPVATAAPVKIWVSPIADEVVDVRLLVLFEVNVKINDIALILPRVSTNAFPFALARGGLFHYSAKKSNFDNLRQFRRHFAKEKLKGE
jgi:hypothetical protein